MITRQGVVAAAFAGCGLTEFFMVSLPWQHEASVALLVLFCATHSAREWGWPRALTFLALVIALVAVAEGFAAELLFGDYRFTDHCTLGPHVLLGRPLFVPLAWYCCAYPALCIARLVLSPRASGTKVSFLAALFTMANNVVADPLMSRYGSSWWVTGVPAPEWIWNLAGESLVFEGVPVRNFVGWFIVSFAFFGAFFALGQPPIAHRVRHPTSVLGASLCIALFYVLHPRHGTVTRISAAVCLLAPVIAAIGAANRQT
jgi:uncharacterized membrane protein